MIRAAHSQDDIEATTDTGGPASTATASRGKRPLPRSQRILLRLVAMIAGAGLAATVIFLFARDTTPEVTQEKLRQAMARWQQAAVANYDLSVATSRDDVFEIEVREGQVTAMTRNGTAFASDRLTETWLVSSQFEYIQNDLRAAARHKKRNTMWLSGVFDPEFGYPLFYRSITSDERPETGWEVTHFRIANP